MMPVREQHKADGGTQGIGRVSDSGTRNLVSQEAVEADSISKFKNQTQFVDWIPGFIPVCPFLFFVSKTDSWAR